MDDKKTDTSKQIQGNKPETNTPLTGTMSAQPGKSLSAGEIGNMNSGVVAPYGHEVFKPLAEPVQPVPVKSVPAANAGPAKQPDKGAPHNQRPAQMGAPKPAAQPAKPAQPAAAQPQVKVGPKVAEGPKSEGAVKPSA